MAALVDARFHQRPSADVVMLDLSLGPYALFREFAQIRRNDIRRGSNAGFCRPCEEPRRRICLLCSLRRLGTSSVLADHWRRGVSRGLRSKEKPAAASGELHVISDRTADSMPERVEGVRPFVPQWVVGLGRSVRSHVKKLSYGGRDSM